MAMSHDQKVSRKLTPLEPAQNEIFVAGEKIYLCTSVNGKTWLTSMCL